MVDIMLDILTNHMILVPLIAWAVSQVVKTIINVIKAKSFSLKYIISDGGMPSAHVATVVSLAVMCGWVEGYDSALFALASVIAVVIIRDSVGVRFDTGVNARAIKKLVALLLAAVCALGAFTSCDRDYDEAEVKAAAESLIKKSDILETIIFGKGFDYHIEGSATYKVADKADVKRYAEMLGEDFTTVDGLKAVLSKVYTAGYKSDIISGVLSGDINGYTRYYQDGENIMVYTLFKVRKTDDIKYHYDTIKVEDVDGEKITVSIKITITNSEGKSQDRTIEVDLIEEAGGWRLDTPTYSVYSENYQDYKDLENELNRK
jgi:acid phosphatase family membrane protein YuiD